MPFLERHFDQLPVDPRADGHRVEGRDGAQPGQVDIDAPLFGGDGGDGKRPGCRGCRSLTALCGGGGILAARHYVLGPAGQPVIDRGQTQRQALGEGRGPGLDLLALPHVEQYPIGHRGEQAESQQPAPPTTPGAWTASDV